MKPANLKKLFGHKYRIKTDPAFHCPRQNEQDREWLYIIPCKAGGCAVWDDLPSRREKAHFFSNGDIDGNAAIGFCGSGGYWLKKLLKIDGVKLTQRGDFEFTVVFPLSKFDKVAEIVKPYARKRYSPEYVEKLKERLKNLSKKPQEKRAFLP